MAETSKPYDGTILRLISVRQQFHESVSISKLLKDGANNEMTSSQNFEEYCFHKLSKLRAPNLQIPDEYLIDAIVGGIIDENLARKVGSTQYMNPNLLYAYLNTMGYIPQKTLNFFLILKYY